ncbi:hypothetical protein HDU93_006537 [Gonapodya sp. JEL0774]|nr:hypothetical protein HDU93_006537 [Gonapodya sp. JEL0774]
MAPVLSTPNDDNSTKSKQKPRLPWWIYFVDITDAVPPVLFCLALVLWNKSTGAKKFYAELFKNFPDKYELAEQMVGVIGGNVSLKWFWGCATAYAILDLLHWPKFLYEYRIQSKPPPTVAYFLKVAAMNFLSSLLIMGPVNKHLMYPIWVARGGMETMKNNLASLGMLAYPLHPSTMWFFSMYRYFETVTSHSGYGLPFTTNALFHNYHHRMFEGNYGIHAGIPFMDMIMGTADDYFQWRYKYALTHHWLTNRKVQGVSTSVEKELDVEGVDKGGAELSDGAPVAAVKEE